MSGSESPRERRPDEEDVRARGGGEEGGRGEEGLSAKVYVGDLGNYAREKDVEDAFGRYGAIRSVWVARRPPGFAFVMFQEPSDAEAAVAAMDGQELCGRRIRCQISHGKSRWPNGRPPAYLLSRPAPRYVHSPPRFRRGSSPYRRSPSPSRERSRRRRRKRRDSSSASSSSADTYSRSPRSSRSSSSSRSRSRSDDTLPSPRRRKHHRRRSPRRRERILPAASRQRTPPHVIYGGGRRRH